MRIAFDEQIFTVQHYGGISRDFVEQIRHLKAEEGSRIDVLPLEAPVVNEYLLQDSQLIDTLRVWQAKGPYSALGRYLRRPRRRDGADIIHNTFYLPRGLSDYPEAKRVATIHDMIPELMPRFRRKLDFLTRKRSYIQQSDHIICVSESTKRDLLRVYPDIRVPITVAYPGVSNAFNPHVAEIEDFNFPFILHVGNRGGYKDGNTLLRAFVSVAHRFKDVVLVLIGGGPLTREEREIFSVSTLKDRVLQTSLPETLIPSAYAHSCVTVFPSLYEGFGLPAVEAMASGSPLILAYSSSLPEVGGDAARYYPPGDFQVLAQRLSEVLSDATASKELSRLGLERAAKFTWANFSQENIKVYEALLG